MHLSYLILRLGFWDVTGGVHVGAKQTFCWLIKVQVERKNTTALEFVDG